MYANRTSDRTRYTVRDAAEVLGISAEAVRARIRRDTIPHEKDDDDGTVYVLLGGDDRTNGDSTYDRTALIEALRSEVAYLREESRRRELRHAEEIRRRDHLLAAALERIPALDAPDGNDGHEPDMDIPPPHSDNAPQRSTARRSWWRRILGS